MNKKILIIPLFLTMLCGCSDNNDITTITDSNTSTDIKPTTTTTEEVFNTIDIESVREKNINETVLIKGIVWKFTYAKGGSKNGFIIADDTSSIYVYGKLTAEKVKEGDEIVLEGTLTHYILDSEVNNANKFGYQGSIQLQNPNLKKMISSNNKVNKKWVKETTVKDIIDTPLSNNITTLTFKVNAVIKHSPQSGYTNYYINDLDEKTGSYVYTQDNGNDFAYLQNYTNKVVTVYLTALNCVSSSSGCKYRFLPVEVIDENYKFDADKNAANFALDYYATNQFSESYYASPDLEVITSLSSDLLGFSDVEISYESDNNNVAYFENIDNKTIFKLKDEGNANIKITAKFSNDIQTRTVKVNKLKSESYETITIKEATSLEDNSEVTVKGIVSVSLGGKKLSSFYLIDKTGSVVVTLVSSDDLKNLSIGDEVIVKGKKTHYISEKTTNGIGQIQIEDASVLVNYYGDNSIPTDSFISKTISELYEIAYDSLVDHSHEIYTIKAKASIVETSYYTNYYLGDNNQKLILYASNGEQYEILNNYLNQELTFNVALVFWNSNNYKLNLIDIVLNDGTIINYNTTLKK